MTRPMNGRVIRIMIFCLTERFPPVPSYVSLLASLKEICPLFTFSYLEAINTISCIVILISFLKMYLGFLFYSSLVRPTVQRVIAIVKIACYLQFPTEGACPATQGCVEKHQGQSGGRRSKEKVWAQAFIVVSWTRQGRHTEQTWDWLV